MKIFLDSNIFLRFYSKENLPTFTECKKIIQACNDGQHRPYTSNIVIQEVVFVLIRLYKFPKSQVLEAIKDLTNIRNLTIVEKTNTRKALDLYAKHNIKLGDCFIATQLPNGVVLCTYDKEFKSIPGFNMILPGDLLHENKRSAES